MHTTHDQCPSPLPGPPARAALATFLDALRGLGFTEQAPHPHGVHTTLLHQDGDRSVAVYYYRCDVTNPSNDGDCNVDISCVDRGGCRALWNATISHIDALPPALALLGAAVNADH